MPLIIASLEYDSPVAIFILSLILKLVAQRGVDRVEVPSGAWGRPEMGDGDATGDATSVVCSDD